MERCSRLIFVLLAVATAIPVVVYSRRSPHIREPAAFSLLSSAKGYVQISGDVRHPGVYILSAKNMTTDVIELAEPAFPVSVFEPPGSGRVPVRNGESLQLHVNANGSARVTRGRISAAERLVLGIPLDINSISEVELDKVPGIGPTLARKIVEYRQNNGGRMSVQDLLLVDGVGEKKFSALARFF
jgi:competence protein ComEA